MTKIKKFKLIDELRLIDNAIKHSGEVTQELTTYGWKIGEKFESL